MPNETWVRAKELDGLPGEWTFPLWSHRAGTLGTHLPTYYEALSDHRAVRRAAEFMADLEIAGLDEPERPALFIDLRMWSSCYGASNGLLELPGPDDRYVGDHAITVVGFDGSFYRFRNTWGLEWGNDGYGYFRHEYVRKYLTEAWISRIAILGPPPYRRIAGVDQADLQNATRRNDLRSKFRETWTSGPDGGRLTIGGHQALAWQLSSLPFWNRALAVRIVPALNEPPVAWLHMIERSGRRWAIEELFVVPEHRGKGIGGELLAWARREAAKLRGSRLVIRVARADEARAEIHGWPDAPRAARDARWWPLHDSRAYAYEATLPLLP